MIRISIAMNNNYNKDYNHNCCDHDVANDKYDTDNSGDNAEGNDSNFVYITILTAHYHQYIFIALINFPICHGIRLLPTNEHTHLDFSKHE